jgi:oligopeptide transport system ATP-binding protein
LFKDLQQEFGLTYLFIAHDLASSIYFRPGGGHVPGIDRGDIRSQGPVQEAPASLYPGAFVSAPIPDPKVEAQRRRIILTGDVPSPDKQRPGCYFYDRCSKRMDHCKTQRPRLKETEDGHQVACFLYHDPE